MQNWRKYWKHHVKAKFNKETCNTAYCDEKHSIKCKYVMITKSKISTKPVPIFISSLKKIVTSFFSSEYLITLNH